MCRAFRIAFKARLYRLLSQRPEYLSTDRAEVIERLLDAPVPLGDLDRTLLLHAGELDRLCGYAVRTLAQRAHTPALHVLAVLDPDRLAAMYYALPEDRREWVRRDEAWAYHVDRVPEDAEQAVAEVAEWAQDSQRTLADRARLTGVAPRQARGTALRHERLALRRDAGLPVLLSEDEREVIAQADEDTARLRQVVGVFTDELVTLGETDDDEAFAAACARAVERCRA